MAKNIFRRTPLVVPDNWTGNARFFGLQIDNQFQDIERYLNKITDALENTTTTKTLKANEDYVISSVDSHFATYNQRELTVRQVAKNVFCISWTFYINDSASQGGGWNNVVVFDSIKGFTNLTGIGSGQTYGEGTSAISLGINWIASSKKIQISALNGSVSSGTIATFNMILIADE